MNEWLFCPRCGSKLGATDDTCPTCGAVTPSAPTTPSSELPAGPSDEDLVALEAELRRALSPSFILVRRLGTGGMGSVFLAREPALKRLVAVKVLAPALAADPGARARFERESQAVARLTHPNIVAIHSVGQLADETPYFVMQYVGGLSLADRLEKEGPLDQDEARRVIGEVASALAVAHSLGIIHRDIKPANILYDDESDRVLVSDFGIAAVRSTGEEGGDTRLTQTGMAVGTPRYMSPEQLLAEDVTEKTDIYALGLLGYELVSGAGPFTATSPQELVAAHLRDTPRPLSEVRDHVDPELESVVSACLAKQATERPSAHEVAQRFTPGAEVLLEWPPPGLAELHGRLPPVSRLFWAGSLLTVVGFLALLTLGPQLSSAVTSFATLTIWIVGTAGIFTLFAAVWKLLRVAAASTRAVRSGFGWLSVAEALADRRGDTGALVAGMREYATLAPPTRDTLRKGRLLRESILLVGGLVPVLALVPLVWLAVGGLVGAGAAPYLLFGPSAVLLIVATSLAHKEARSVGPGRARLGRHRSLRGGDPRIAASWTETFERVRRGQSLGSGAASRPLASRVGAFVVAISLLLVITVFAPVGLVGVLGPVLLLGVNVSNTEARLRIAETARAFALPPDSSITPLEAGRAFYTLQGSGGSSTGAFPQHALPRELTEGWHDQDFPDDLFDREVMGPDGQPLQMKSSAVRAGPNHMTILEYAASGLNTDEVRYLEHLAALPQWDEYRTVARAAAMDYVGARFVLPFTDSATAMEMPMPKFAATKQAAYASVEKAALFLAQGRHAEAETTLRETISFGFRLVDDGNTLFDALIGMVTVGLGQNGLVRFYSLTDRPEGAVLRARRDSVVALEDELRAARGEININDVAGLRRDMLAILQDTTRLRSQRWEMLVNLSFVPCSNVRELLFGPGEDLAAAFAQARRDLVRFESEDMLLDLMLDTPARGLPFGDSDPPVFRLSDAVGRVAGWVLGNERIAGCTTWLTRGLDFLNVVR